MRSSGRAGCHSSEIGGYASFFDIDAPGSWTDTLPMTGVVMAAGLATEHKYLGYLPPDTNFGFDREVTIFPTRDIDRMKAFFLGEFERRGGTEEDIEKAIKIFTQINGGLFDLATPCGPDEGINSDGRIIWKGGEARQIYIQELNAGNPGSPPNFDTPEGTTWALYANPDSSAFEAGTVIPGAMSPGATQAIPADPAEPPVFEVGQSYRLFVTPDFMRSPYANCTFTFGEELAESGPQTCESEGTLCVTLQIPEALSETPEKLVIGLYESLPPLGPPDVFPPYSVDAPEVTPGETMKVILDANATGVHQIYAVLYMPGGGAASWQPLSGVDHVGTSAPIPLDGSGMVLDEPIVFELAP